MPTYIVLGQFTEQGIRNVKDTSKRADAAKELAKKFGATARILLDHRQPRLCVDHRSAERRSRDSVRIEFGQARQCSHRDLAGVHAKRDLNRVV